MDINVMAQLLSMILGGNKNEKTNTQNDTQPKNTSVFAMQNGLGEQVDVSEKKNNMLDDILKNMSAQNPLLGLISSMQNSKGDISSLLPLISSLMSKTQTQNNQENNEKNPQKNDENPSKTSENNTQNNSLDDNLNDENIVKSSELLSADKKDISGENLQEKTQQDLFAPVAFGGYQMLCLLYRLLKSKRNPCR